MKNRRAFWLVWCPQGGSPTREHETRDSARRESDRLARMNRGRRFIVLRSESECVVDDVQHIEHEDWEEVPF
jgi:hypothetical protein